MTDLIDFPTFMSEWNFLEGQVPEQHHSHWAEILPSESFELKIDGPSSSGRTQSTALFLAWSAYRDPAFTGLWIAADQNHADRARSKLDGILQRHPRCEGLSDFVTISASMNLIRESRASLLVMDVFGMDLGKAMKDRRAQAASCHCSWSVPVASVLVGDVRVRFPSIIYKRKGPSTWPGPYSRIVRLPVRLRLHHG